VLANISIGIETMYSKKMRKCDAGIFLKKLLPHLAKDKVGFLEDRESHERGL